MILILNETPTQIIFENTRTGNTFVAWLEEETQDWVVTKQGAQLDFGALRVGRVARRQDVWLGFAGTIPTTEPEVCRSRNDALAWISDDGDGLAG
ncbi:hypothetical protein LLS1_01730 [Leifsonia sp. LS1]|uniref:hypothetical protein n=1 Tax=Leifsonia sp. LS1 TaxID=2828483 RepID=UPI001CFDD561|nr:hypothetical protein [Leifsonia sp. LS1]GIT78504.1 hypothetical protein LLS1_01730 [Leifsonia sp. LS1]